MSLAELTNGAGPWGRSAITALIIFIALWFDPRITYIQRDVSDNRSYMTQIDNNGTRKSQQEWEAMNGTINDNKRRIEALEKTVSHTDDTLTAILTRMSEKR